MLYWGVRPFAVAQPSSLDDLFSLGRKLPGDLGIAKPGDLLVITGGVPIGVAGTTNLLKVERVP